MWRASVERKHVLSHEEQIYKKRANWWSWFRSGLWHKNTFSVKTHDWVWSHWGLLCAGFQQIQLKFFLADKSLGPQMLSTNPTNETLSIQNSTTLQKYSTSPTKAFFHTLSCHDGGRPGGYTHTLSSIIQ